MHDAEFERLYAEEAESLFAFLAYRTGDRLLAEDILADTFERALRARHRFDPRRGAERAWLYSIAVNLLRDRARRVDAEDRALARAGGGNPAAEGSGEDPRLDAVDRRDWIDRGMRVLSPEEREAVALRFGAGLSSPEIARVTGQSLSTAEGRVYRALRKMRAEMGAPPLERP